MVVVLTFNTLTFILSVEHLQDSELPQSERRQIRFLPLEFQEG